MTMARKEKRVAICKEIQPTLANGCINLDTTWRSDETGMELDKLGRDSKNRRVWRKYDSFRHDGISLR